MNNFGFNGLNNDNPLAQLLRQYVPQQPIETPQPTPEPQRMNNGGITAFEISSKSDIEYIEPDKSGRKQIYICESADKNENKIYVGRYNHVRKEMDYRAYVDEGDISLFQKNDTNESMTQIAQALGAVVNKLEAMHSEIQSLKDVASVKEESVSKATGASKTESVRKPNGQFKKRCDS